MTESIPAPPEKIEDFYVEQLRALVREARRHPPRFGHIAPPLNVADVLAHCSGGLYEGFEEDVKRMRRGLPALGPRE
jgi:hypothetical protein